MEKIYSKVDPNQLIYVVVKLKDINSYRLDASPEQEYLQLSARSLSRGTVVEAHKHLPVEKITTITQEAWIVFKGMIKGTFYDLDNEILGEVLLTDGDAVILFRGGHKLEVLEENTIFYELKTGPYYGKIADKEFIK